MYPSSIPGTDAFDKSHNHQNFRIDVVHQVPINDVQLQKVFSSNLTGEESC